MSLKDLAAYSGLSVRTLRGHLVHGTDPLPHYRIGGKLLVRRSEFDEWAARFKANPLRDAAAVVDALLRGL